MKRTTCLERGGSSFSVIVALLFLAALIFAAIRLLPPYIMNYQLQGEIETVARNATYSRKTETDIRNEVQAVASQIGIHLADGQVAVQRTRTSVDIAVHYEVPVDLMVRRIVLTFEPGAGNRNITAR